MFVVGDTAIDRTSKPARDTELVCSWLGLGCVVLFPAFRNAIVGARAWEEGSSSFGRGTLFSPGLSFGFCRGDVAGATGVLFRSAGPQTTK